MKSEKKKDGWAKQGGKKSEEKRVWRGRWVRCAEESDLSIWSEGVGDGRGVPRRAGRRR